ncbi:glycoside hydrolase family 127 protein [Luteibacter sp. UNCMF366Tsu5.1]|uniref:glycoside hydrolase family 127 protein n=1 Tax=Luteibacter sp. UNCMF366Tsu5.1 TaxID=1502758 RepID=UPI0009091B65|nr:beta-L-arabinofuranosidase domain-containing protein [Luteibacter sp. UNCMF366Tsu5.1]SFW64256.1 hypothetical protein SAMN02800691_2793 [Luteibacter sp. UNCMF366Tsu5.1]
MMPRTRFDGLLGDALAANLRGRLSHFIVDETSPAIVLFSPERRATNEEGDWYGEHAGKWLVAASRAAARSGDAALRTNVIRVADYLLSVQEPDGYLGTYAPARRFMHPRPPRPVTWDGAPSVRTWDIWTHAYLVLGLIEVHRQLGGDRYLDAARRIGDLCLRTLGDGGIDITDLGNHFGMSATVLLDPAVELHVATGDARYLDLARLVLAQADANPHLALLRQALAGADAAFIGTGKAYQLAWNMVGVAKLHRVTDDPALLNAARNVWASIREHHLTLGGGPWGGVAHRSREVFNAPGAFSPEAYIETCSTLAWIQLNRELLAATGEACFAEEIERSAYNDLLAAQAPDGEGWCYYVFPNGRRVHTTYWRCCKSSGAMAIEELPALATSVRDGATLDVNLYGPGETVVVLEGVGLVTLRQDTAWPYPDDVRLHVALEREGRFALRLRIPSWADGAVLLVNGEAAGVAITPGEYASIERVWRDGDQVTAVFPFVPVAHRASNRNVQESRAPDGSEVRQEVLRFDYVGFTCGPLVYATERIDGFKTAETVRLPEGPSKLWLKLDLEEGGAPALSFYPGYRPPLRFTPYFAAGGRRDGAWRLTWLQVAAAD